MTALRVLAALATALLALAGVAVLAGAEQFEASDAPRWRLGWQRPLATEGLERERCLAQCRQEIAEWRGVVDAELPSDVAADLAFCRPLVEAEVAQAR